MTNATGLRLSLTENYKIRFPIVGRSFLAGDYSSALLQGLVLNRVLENYLHRNPAWSRSGMMFSHSLTFWSGNRWFVQWFYVGGYTHHRHRYHRVYRRLQSFLHQFGLQQDILYHRLKQELATTYQRLAGCYRPVWIPRLHRRLAYTWFYRSHNDRVYLRAPDYRTWPAAEVIGGMPVVDRQRVFLYQRGADLQSMVKPPRLANLGHPPYLMLLRRDLTGHRLSYFPPDMNPVSEPSRTPRHTTTDYIQWPAINPGRPSFEQLFKVFIRQIHPRGARLGRLADLTRRLAAEYQRVVANRVGFGWRRLRYYRHGLIPVWLGFVRFRVAERGSYRIRSIVYPLLRFSRRHRLPVKGWSIRCAGRFSRQQRAEYKVFHYGRGVKRNSFNYRADQSLFTFPLKFGSIGLTITVRY